MEENISIHEACKKEDVEMLNSLIDAGHDVNTKDNTNKTPLHCAAIVNNVDIVNMLVEAKCDINARDEKMKTPLHYAVEKSNLEIVSLLIEAGCDVNPQDEDHKYPIHLAFESHNEKIIQVLIKNGADLSSLDKYNQSPLSIACQSEMEGLFELLIEENINMKDQTGCSLLHFASIASNVEFVKKLLDRKCDANVNDKTNKTPLHCAAIVNNVDIVNMLIEAKCDINAPDETDMTPIHYACQYGNAQIVRRLIELECDVNSCDKNGKRPIHYSCNIQAPGIVYFLITALSDINVADESGKYPIHYAIECNNTNIFHQLINASCNINAEDKERKRPIHYAVFIKRKEILRKLLEKQCELNVKDKFGRSPLHYAVLNNNCKVAKLLIEAGCDVDIFDEQLLYPIHCAVSIEDCGDMLLLLSNSRCNLDAQDILKQTPLMVAVKNKDIATARKLIDWGCNVNICDKYKMAPLHYACENDSLDLVDLLLSNNCEINIKDRDDMSPLHYACKYDRVEVTKKLIAAHCDVNIEDTNLFRPIHISARSNYLEIFKELVKLNCDIEATDNKDTTALHYSARHESIDVMKELIKMKCKLNVKNNFGNYPIHIACEKNNVEAVRTLIKAGCEISIQNESGERPIHIACQKNNIEIIKALIEEGDNINATDNNQHTPILHACRFDSVTAAEFLIKNRCNVDVEDDAGHNPLYVASKHSSVSMVRLLLDNQCKIKNENELQIHVERIGSDTIDIDILEWSKFHNISDMVTYISKIWQLPDNEFHLCGYDGINNYVLKETFEFSTKYNPTYFLLNIERKLPEIDSQTSSDYNNNASQKSSFEIHSNNIKDIKKLIGTSHPNLVRVLDIVVIEDKCHVITEHVDGEELDKYMNNGTLSELSWKNLFNNIILGILELIRLDLKLRFTVDNIFISYSLNDIKSVKLAPFSHKVYSKHIVEMSTESFYLVEFRRLLNYFNSDTNSGTNSDTISGTNSGTNFIMKDFQSWFDRTYYKRLNDDMKFSDLLYCSYLRWETEITYEPLKWTAGLPRFTVTKSESLTPTLLKQEVMHKLMPQLKSIDNVVILSNNRVIDNISSSRLDIHAANITLHYFCVSEGDVCHMNADNYHIVDIGGYSRVLVDTSTVQQNHKLAFKCFDHVLTRSDITSIEMILKEVEILSTCHHKNIVKYNSLFRVGYETLVISMEFMEGGTLNQLVKLKCRMNDDEIKFFLKQILSGLSYLHKNNIIHLDVKCDNVLLDKDYRSVKLGDFGLSVKLRGYDEICNDNVMSTARFLAPELLRRKGFNKSVDIWSLGGAIIEMATGMPPNPDKSDIGCLTEINTKMIYDKTCVSEEMQKLIHKCTNIDPSARPTAHELFQKYRDSKMVEEPMYQISRL